MTEYVMPDLAELNRLSGREHYWYVDQWELFGYLPDSLHVKLMRKRRWLGDETVRSLAQDGDNLGGSAESVARWAVDMATRILHLEMSPWRRTDVNGLTGAVFSDRIEHG